MAEWVSLLVDLGSIGAIVFVVRDFNGSLRSEIAGLRDAIVELARECSK